MAALWRRTLLAPTRSTPCFGSASSPRRSSSSRSTSRCSPRSRRYRAAAAAPSRARCRAAARLQLRVGARPHRLRRRDLRPRHRLHRPGPGDAGDRRRRPSPPRTTEPLKIEATGQQWLWRYDYPNGAFSYYKLVVPADTAVKLKLVSTDVVHTWNVPDLSGKRDAVPGKVNQVLLPGRRRRHLRPASRRRSPARATRRCGPRSRSSRPSDYEEFVKRQKADIEAAQERVVGLIENGEVAMSDAPRPELVVDGFPQAPPALDRARHQRRPQGPRPAS